MRSTRGDKRFWESTRGRIILLLRRGSRSVNEMARAVGLTDNAVRTHLTSLERDGLVRPSGTRPGTRKPNILYDLTPEAERLFPKMYGPVLRHFLDVLNERIAPKKLDEIVCAVGRRMAQSYQTATPAGPAPDRADRAVRVLRELGGSCEPERRDGKIVLHCFDCPLSVAVAGHPEVCRLMETMLAEVLGVAVRQHCKGAPTPQCSFEIGEPAAARTR
jgi:predicted ArsR family transcriptional regulator